MKSLPYFLVTIICLHNADGVSNAGKTFFQTFNFNQPGVEPGVLHAFILSSEADQCEVDITVDEPPLTTSTIPVNNTQAVVVHVNANSTRGIRLNASCDFVAYGLNFAMESADGWMAIPVEALDREYVVLGVQPWLPTEPTQLTIVAAYDNTVCNSTFPNGTQHVSQLNSIQVDYMTSDQDFTGTLISCNEKVTVLTGQRCSFVPAGCHACDHTIEQVPPKRTLGRNFIMAPLAHSCKAKPKCCSDPVFCAKCTEIYRIMAVENDTEIVRNGTETSETFTLHSGQSRYILLSQTEFSHLISSKPVLLGHYFNGENYEGINEDPSFAIIPQIESYSQRYQAATCFPQFKNHYFNLIVPKGTSGQLLLNGQPFVNANSARIIPGTDWEAVQFQCDCSHANDKPTSYTLQHSNNASFGLFAYGFSAWISYGYPGGMNLNTDVYYSTSTESTSSTTVTTESTTTEPITTADPPPITEESTMPITPTETESTSTPTLPCSNASTPLDTATTIRPTAPPMKPCGCPCQCRCHHHHHRHKRHNCTDSGESSSSSESYECQGHQGHQ